MNYIQFEFTIKDPATAEKLIALLSDEDFDGFEETPGILKAYIGEADFKQEVFDNITAMFEDLVFSKTIIENKNWNEQWESSFEPVLVHDFAGIRASFHEPLKNVQHEIVITPKMSFGTGHHATTFLMVEQMASLDFKNKAVIDFGTGTGVLAILAEKLGAEKIYALDNDEWSIDNAKENIAANGCSKIELYRADTIAPHQKGSIILANINLNVITANLAAIAAACEQKATILFSGLLIADKPTITTALQRNNFTILGYFEKDNWLAISTKCEKM